MLHYYTERRYARTSAEAFRGPDYANPLTHYPRQGVRWWLWATCAASVVLLGMTCH